MNTQHETSNIHTNSPTAHFGRAGERGFTLLETTIALVIMLIVALGAATVFSYAIGYGSASQDRAQALALAQKEVEKWRTTAFVNVVTTAAVTDNSMGRPFTVETSVVNTTTTMKTITVTVKPTGAGPQWAKTNSTDWVTIVTQRANPV